jgi:RNA polymerase sigma-70 factor (ECF subfamily)
MDNHEEARMIATRVAQSAAGEDLYRRFLAGDEGAFEALFALYDEELFYFIKGIVQDHHEAKHLMIEAFAQLAVGGGRFAGKSSLKTYLFAIGKNLAAKYVGTRGREPHIPFEEIVEWFFEDPQTPHNLLEQKENRRQLHAAMGALKEEYRAVLILLYFEDMSYIEAGRALNKSVKQISNLAYRAKAALKKKLESDGYTHEKIS